MSSRERCHVGEVANELAGLTVSAAVLNVLLEVVAVDVVAVDAVVVMLELTSSHLTLPAAGLCGNRAGAAGVRRGRGVCGRVGGARGRSGKRRGTSFEHRIHDAQVLNGLTRLVDLLLTVLRPQAVGKPRDAGFGRKKRELALHFSLLLDRALDLLR